MPFELSTVAIISIASLLFSVFVWFQNSKRTDTKDIEERAADSARINVKLDTISNNVMDVKGEVGSLSKTVHAQEEKLILVEASTKSAHKRIDSLEERLNMSSRSER